MGIPNMLRFNRLDLEKYSKEEINELFKKHNQCMDKASDESLKPFRDTWYGGTEELDKKINKGWPFGALYDALENMRISEYDKYWIARLFVSKIEKEGQSLMFALGEYFSWCIDNHIEVNRLKFMSFFSQYLREIPEDVAKAYEKSSEKAFRDKIYGKKEK